MPLELKRKKGSPNWYVRGTVRGEYVEESTKTPDRALAEDIRARREVELGNRSVYGARAVATFTEAVVIYLEQGGERRFLAPILDLWKSTKLGEIDQTRIDAGARRLYPNASPATRNRQFYTPVSAVLRAAAARKLCDLIEIKRPKAKDGKVRWITPEEADRLIEACAPHLRPLVIFMLYTGARCGEALYLDWRDVALSRRHVTFGETKNGDARGVALHRRVVAALANLPHRSDAVFRKPDGSPYPEPDPRKDSDTSAGSRIKTAFRGACERTGLGHYEEGKAGKLVFKANFTPHDCRHTWATWHYAANRDLIGLKELGGWKSERMVLRYAHMNVAHLAPSIDALPWAKSEKSGKSKSRSQNAS